MTEILITAGVGLVTTIVSSWSTWVFARKKYNSEVDHNIIDNMKESLEFYEKLSNDNKARLTEALEENKKLREDLNRVLEENKALKKDMDEIKSQMIKLTTSICYDLSCKIRMREEYLNKEGKEDEKGNTE